jgi:tetratricopeptide (TPR) repeat protein
MTMTTSFRLVTLALVMHAFQAGWPVRADDASPAATSLAPERRVEIAKTMMEEGERLWRDAEREKAMDAFETALGIWEGVEADYPGWQPHFVRSRILYAESAIRQIREGRPFAEATPSDSLPRRSLDILAATDEKTAAALRALRAGIEERDAALQQAREENRRQAEEIAALRRQLERYESRTGKAEDVPAIARAIRSEARRLLESSDAAAALTLLEEGVQWFRQDDAMTHLLAVAYCQAGRYGDALRVLNPLIRWGRGSAEVWMTVGVAYLGLENLGRARWAFEKALARNPRSAEAHYNLASILIKLPKPEAEEAALHYGEARQLGLPADPGLEEEIRRAMLWQRARSLR